MPRSTTRAGLAPRLFTPKITALPRTPYFIGVFAERGACKGIWIGRVVHLGPSSGAAAAFVGGSAATNQHNSLQCWTCSAVCDGAPVSRRSFRRGSDQCQEFGA